jgi:carboxymethylenebutenolidase
LDGRRAMDQKLVDLYYEYLHAPLRRRIFLLRLAKLTGGEEEALAAARQLDAMHARGELAPSDEARREFGPDNSIQPKG